MNNTQQNMDAVQRLLERKQSVPSQMTRALLIDLRVARTLNAALQNRIDDLEARVTELEGYIDRHNDRVLAEVAS